MTLGTRGPWRKLKQIGEGSFGKVYLVQRSDGQAGGKTFVMKEVQLRGLPRHEMEAAQKEVAVLRKLRHPHIVAIEEALVAEETLCIVMEYADGKDLDTLIKQRKQQRKPFTEEEVLKIFWQLTSALAHCHHDHHMLHRDLKPANVFMMASGDVKLGDFGLAKIVEATCAFARTQCGTPLYMSPELCLGQDYNRAADVWALGCVLYELMTLTMPWADVAYNGAGGMSALLKKIANSSLDLTPCKARYSLELCNLLASLLNRNGRNRPSLKHVLQEPLMQRAAPKPAAAAPPPVDLSANEAAPSRGGLPPSWRKVPSASRPGEFSYLHVPTGYKQAFPPERDELPDAVVAALKKATFTPSKRPPPTALAPPSTPQQAAHTPRQGDRTPSSRQAPTPGLHCPGGGGGGGGTPRQGCHTPQQQHQYQQHPKTPGSRAAQTPGGDAPLPPNWKKVPSASRPGSFSYLHLPTGYKQAEVPTSDAPPPAALAAWQRARANGPVATGAAHAGGPTPSNRPGWQRGKLEPVNEGRSNAAAARQGFDAAPSKGKVAAPPPSAMGRGGAQYPSAQRPRY